MSHNPEHTAREIAEKLAARSRHVTFLIGAGASCAGGLPDVDGLKLTVAEALEHDDRTAFDALAASRNIEQVLSRLRLLAQALEDSTDTVDGFSAATASKLDQKICARIASTILQQSDSTDAHERFATWAGLSRYDRPIEVFTTNYDLLIERALELAVVPYFDGFVGIYDAHFRADLVDSTDIPDYLQPPARWVRVWKLHGSISWTRVSANDNESIVRTGTSNRADPENALAIYPSLQKYEESRRIPFVVLGDRFRRSLAIPETLCIVSGYSFGDDHINQLLFDAARFHRASEVLALFYSKIPDHVADRARTVPNLTLLGPARAVIGGIDAEWDALPGDTPFWNDGAFTLGDFRALSSFLLFNTRREGPRDDSEDLDS